jgi:hypothetical protein
LNSADIVTEELDDLVWLSEIKFQLNKSKELIVDFIELFQVICWESAHVDSSIDSIKNKLSNIVRQNLLVEIGVRMVNNNRTEANPFENCVSGDYDCLGNVIRVWKDLALN